MAKETQDSAVQTAVEVTKEREVKLVFISDGVYKYIYADTGEDVV